MAEGGLEGLLAARRVAVVGASDVGYFSERLRENLARGARSIEVVAVNARARKVWGRKAWPSLAALPERPDLALVIVPAKEAAAAVREAARIGVGHAIVLAQAATPKEADVLAKACRTPGIAVMGPESMGVMDVLARRFLFCGRLPEIPRAGRVSIVSRSGGLAIEAIRAMRDDGRLGMRRLACTGREGGMGAADVIRDLAKDDGTAAVILILESDPCAASLLPGIEAIGAAGKEAILISTAADGTMEGRVVEALASRTGAFLARSMDEAIEAAAVAEARPAGRGRGGAAWVASASAGVGEWLEREARSAGLPSPEPSRATSRAIAKALGPAAGKAIASPIDLTAAAVTDASVLESVVAAMAADPGTGAVLVSLHPSAGKSYSDRRNARWLEFLGRRGRESGRLVMPVQATAAVAAPAMGMARGASAAARIAAWWIRPAREAAAGERPAGTDRQAGHAVLYGPPRTLSEPASRRLLAAYGVALDPWMLAGKPSQAVRCAREIGGPVEIRIASPDIGTGPGTRFSSGPFHGPAGVSEASIDLIEAARTAFPEARLMGILVTRHRPRGPAISIRARPCGPGAPPLVEVGPGGIAGMMDGRRMPALCPIGRGEAMDLARRAAGMLPAGGPEGPLADMIERVALLAADFPGWIGSVVVDPVVLDGEGWAGGAASVIVGADVPRPD